MKIYEIFMHLYNRLKDFPHKTNEYLNSQYITMKKHTILIALLHFNVLHNIS